MIHEVNGCLLKTRQSFSDFVNMACELSSESGVYGSCGAPDSSFYGDADTFEQMVERCYDGYAAKTISDKRHEIGGMLDYQSMTPELSHTGDELDIPTYLSGDMRCWWRDSDNASTPKRVHITYSANCIASFGSSSFANHGGAIAVICDTLDAMGIHTKISCTFSNLKVMIGKALQVIEVKEYGESIDIPRIGVTTHPSFFRRIGFRYFEQLCSHLGLYGEYEGCYGKSQTGSNRASEVIPDDEFAEWLRIADDEIVIDLPAANLSVFKDTNTTAEWVEKAIKIIESSNGERHIKIFK